MRRVYTFDTQTQTWSTTTPLPQAVSSPAVIAVGRAVYVAGGLSDTGQPVSSVFTFDTDTQRWGMAPMQTARSNAAVAVLDGGIYVLGGDGAAGILSSVERYDLATGRWTWATPLPEPLMNLGAATVGGAIHALFEQAHYVFNPTRNRWTRMAPMIRPRHSFGTAVIGDQLYVIGGCDPEPEDTAITEILDVNGAS